jgi:Tripartite tricarboxylate transporter TctB family
MKYLPSAGLGMFTVAFLAAAYGYPSQARAFPVAVAWVTLFLVALDILSRTDTRAGVAVRRRLNPGAAAEDSRPLSSQIRAVTWLAGIALALVLIGILYALPPYIFASLRFRGRRSWFKCLWITAIATGGIWLLFAVVLRLDLYPGYFFGGS